MTTVLLIRHGLAQDPQPGMKDSDRALTPEGWDRTRAAMRGLVKRGWVPTRGVSSPYRRAVETLTCLKEAAGTDFPVACWEGLVPEASAVQAEIWLRAQLAEAGTDEVIALVSHLPLIPDLLDHLCGTWVSAKKASCTVLEWDGCRIRLGEHLSPRELREG